MIQSYWFLQHAPTSTCDWFFIWHTPDAFLLKTVFHCTQGSKESSGCKVIFGVGQNSLTHNDDDDTDTVTYYLHLFTYIYMFGKIIVHDCRLLLSCWWYQQNILPLPKPRAAPHSDWPLCYPRCSAACMTLNCSMAATHWEPENRPKGPKRKRVFRIPTPSISRCDIMLGFRGGYCTIISSEGLPLENVQTFEHWILAETNQSWLWSSSSPDVWSSPGLVDKR